MVEQRREDISGKLETLNRLIEDSQNNFTRSIGKLLVSVDAQQARNAVLESTYYIVVTGGLRITADLLEGTRGVEEVQDDIDFFNNVVGMLRSPLKDWASFKLGVQEGGKIFYEDGVEEQDDFDLKAVFGLPENLYVGGIPLLEPTEFVEIERQKEMFNGLLLRKLNLVPNEKSLWEHPRAVDFTFDFELP